MKYKSFQPFVYLAVILLFTQKSWAQETWSLERCLQHARDNNLTLKQAEASVRTAILSEKQAKANRLPNVSGSISGGEQFGRTIDPTTNQFSTVATNFNSLGVNAGVTIFNGGLINHSIKQAGWDLKAAQADAQQTGNTLALSIASAYLNILLTEEQLENAQKRIETSRQQLSTTQKLINAGTLPLADQYNVMAQLARDEQTAVQVQNNLELGYLTLKQFLQLEPDFDLRIERPEVLIPADANPDMLGLPAVYETARETQTSVKAAEYREMSAKEGIAIAKSGYYPSINLGANLSSNYSSQFQDYNVVGVRDGDPQTIKVGGVPVEVSFPEAIIEASKIPYGKQIEQNFGQGIFMSMNIPIYQNGRTRLNVERARLGVLTAELQKNQAQQQLKNDIQTAIANARAARRQLEAAQKTNDAMQTAFQNTEKRHAIGTVNSLDLVTARNNRDIAENDLVVARYDYLFKLKILDFYLGKPIALK
ncbi:MAG: TolC family protein [Saprospiraceae bacterium]|nr:TolC family protein [Saprospiraceae bacterium]